MADNRGGPRGRNSDERGQGDGQGDGDRSRRTQALALSAWDLARTRTRQPDAPRGQVIALRNHQRLLQAFEHERSIPEPDRSLLRVQDEGRGSCLLIHGVSTHPSDLYDLAEVLFDAGYTVYVLRLPDFGTQGNTIGVVSW